MIQSIVLRLFSFSVFFVFANLIYFIVVSMDVPTNSVKLQSKKTVPSKYVELKRKNHHQSSRTHRKQSAFPTKQREATLTQAFVQRKYANQPSPNKIRNRY